MKKRTRWVMFGSLLIISLFMMTCEAPEQPTYGPDHPDPNPTGLNPAKIDSISPGEGYLKDIVKIYGSDFNTTPDFNLVSFGKSVGKVVEASPTELSVQTPSISGETVPVKMAIKGSEFWSNSVDFTFLNTLKTIDEEIAWPNGVAVDNDENVYIGSAGDGVIYKITPDGDKTEFASVPVNGAIKFGPNNYLYVCEQGEGKIVRISPDGATIEDVVEVESPVGFDWDASGNMYIVENETGIHRLDTGGVLTYMTDFSSAKSCRVFQNYLYATSIWDGHISRFEITGNGLGAEETVLDEIDSPVGLEFDAEGTMYYTLAWETSLYTLSASGEEGVLYEGELMTPMRYLSFHNKTMYIVYPGWGDVGQTMSAYIGVEQAPNYGLQ